MAVIAVVASMTTCISAITQSPAAPPTIIVPAVAAAPMPTLIVTVGQPVATALVTRTATASVSATCTDSPIPTNAVFELQQRMQTHELSKLRITCNRACGTSLLFAQSDLTYYVTLSQQKDLWRITKTTNRASTERLYSDPVEQTQATTDLELQRIRLEARKERSECQIATQQEKLCGLKADLNIQHQQQAQAQRRQKIARTEAEALDVECRAARTRVDESWRQIRGLEAQVNASFNSRSHRC